MREKGNRTWIHIIWLGVLLLVTIVAAVSVGSAKIPMKESFLILLSRIPYLGRLADIEEINPVYITIIMRVRLPRILLAALVGSGLSIVGATFQGLFRNQLADPHILGVSSGASLGATIAILSGVTFNLFGIGVIGLFAFIGAVITVFLVYYLASLGGKMNVGSILLTGTAVSTMLSSFVSLLMAFYNDDIEKVYLWTLGSFTSATWTKIQFVLPILLIGTGIVLLYARELNIILTGDEVAESLGVNTAKVKKVLIVVCSMVVAACVSVSGIIGFVGLIIPHCFRLMTGPDHRKLLPLCCIGGAIFMIFSDGIARTIAAPTEIPVGVITAIFGAPYFIFLLYRNQKETKVNV